MRPFAWNHNSVGLVKTSVLLHYILLFFRITVPECIASLDNHQQCWQLLRSFACTTQQMPTSANNSQHCWTNNVVTCCVRFCKSLQGVTQQVKLIGTLTCVLRITICAFAFHVFYDRFVALLFRYSVVTGITWRLRNLARCTRGGSTTMVSWVTGLRRSTR